MTGGLLAEIACILYLCSIDSPMDVIIRFIAMGSIAKVDDFYASALPGENRITTKWSAKCPNPMLVKHRRRQIRSNSPGCSYWIGRFVYKCYRIFYVSFVFYFMPYSILVVPYFFNQMSEN